MDAAGPSRFDAQGTLPASSLAAVSAPAFELVGVAGPVGLLLEIGLALISPGCGPPS